MLYLNVLNGIYAGKQFPLNQGINTVGRGDQCTITLQTPNVSKQHIQLEVYNDKVILTDLNSTNGTFVNGLKVNSIRLHLNDKIALFDTLIEITDIKKETQKQMVQVPSAELIQPHYSSSPHQPGALDNFHPSPSHAKESKSSSAQLNFNDKAKNYLETVALPGVYKLLEITEFKWLMTGFLALFVLIVTVLSTLPLTKILRSSIQQESQMRAQTIARTLARLNRKNLINGLEAAVTVEFINGEPGVKKAYIVSGIDGKIIAPKSNQQYPNEPFIHSARTQGKLMTKQINSSTIGAIVPIEFYNPNTGTQGIIAYAAVIYNMNSLAVNDSRVISLFIQTLFISMVFGALLFFFLYRLIIHPIQHLNKQVDLVLRDKAQSVTNQYQFPVLDKISDNINSLINRNFDSDSSNSTVYDRNQEISNLLTLIASPALIYLPAEKIIAGSNESFEQLTGLNTMALMNQNLEQITDQALQQNILELINNVKEAPESSFADKLEIGGYNYRLQAQSIYGESSIAYILIVIQLDEEVAA